MADKVLCDSCNVEWYAIEEPITESSEVGISDIEEAPVETCIGDIVDDDMVDKPDLPVIYRRPPVPIFEEPIVRNVLTSDVPQIAVIAADSDTEAVDSSDSESFISQAPIWTDTPAPILYIPIAMSAPSQIAREALEGIPTTLIPVPRSGPPVTLQQVRDVYRQREISRTEISMYRPRTQHQRVRGM